MARDFMPDKQMVVVGFSHSPTVIHDLTDEMIRWAIDDAEQICFDSIQAFYNIVFRSEVHYKNQHHLTLEAKMFAIDRKLEIRLRLFAQDCNRFTPEITKSMVYSAIAYHAYMNFGKQKD